MTISIIAAIAKNNVIGKDNDLIWHISEDLKRFKKITSGHTVIMGRKTYESLPFKPLPKRKNIIITRNKHFKPDGVIVVNSPDEAILECKGEEEVFICGGATIYESFIDEANKLYLTKILKEFEGDTFFPIFETSHWKEIYRSKIFTDIKSKIKYQFIDMIKHAI